MRPSVGRLVAVVAACASALAGAVVPAVPAAATSACELDSPGVGREHEGPTEYSHWLEPTGTLRAIFVFVDFSDATPAPGERTGRMNLFDPAAADWIATSSYGGVSLDFDFTPTWYRMPNPQDEYIDYSTSFTEHRKYLQHAVGAADAAVDFTGYDLVYVVSPASASAIKTSPAFIAPAGLGLQTNEGELRHGANFGQDVGAWGYNILNHETGHVFGLPDLYAYGYPYAHERLHKAAGGWDLMSLTSGPAPDHFAWHKWKAGWLDDTQITCRTTAGQTTTTLTPLGTAGGMKAVVVKTGPQRAIVVENRQVSSLDVAGPCFQPGLLAYAVDTSAVGGDEPDPVTGEGAYPLQVLDRTPGNPAAGCAPENHGLHDADLVNATLTAFNHQVTDAESGVTVRRLGSSGGNVTVEVTW